MRYGKILVTIVMAGVLFLAACGGSGGDSDKTTITYWQYTFPSKVEEIDRLIEEFEEENPDIKVEAQDFPYDQYNDKITAAMHADEAPDILNIYYGWIPNFVQLDYI